MSLQFSVLASGSTGNAFYLETDEHAFLVDAGLSGKQMVEVCLVKSIASRKTWTEFLSHTSTQIILKDSV